MAARSHACLLLLAILVPCGAQARRDDGATARAEALVRRMTLEEKIAQMGIDSPAIPRLGIPAHMWGGECLHGVVAPNVTVFPSAIGLASAWNPELMERVARAIGVEARALYNAGKGSLGYFSPVVNMARDPRWGRVQETYGEDPYLTARLGAAYVRGLQGDDSTRPMVAATVKHFAVYSDESRRHFLSASVDRGTLFDYYLPAFKACVVEGGVRGVMCAYNAVSGTPCCASAYLLDTVLRGEWGFDGVVVSDCTAIDDIYASHKYARSEEEAPAFAVKAGCDMECGRWYRNHLADAVTEGLVSEPEIDRSVVRIIREKIRLGLLDPPGKSPYSGITADRIDSPEHRALALDAARQSLVLLKNDGVLPFGPGIRSVAVIGPFADRAKLGNYSGTPSRSVSPVDGIRAVAGPGVAVIRVQAGDMGRFSAIPAKNFSHGLKGEYFANTDTSGTPVLTRKDSHIEFDWGGGSPGPRVPRDDFSVRWTGVLKPPVSRVYTFNLAADDGVGFFLDGKLLLNHWHERNSMESYSVTVYMEAGRRYPVQMDYYEARGLALARLEWDLGATAYFGTAAEAARRSDAAVVFVGTDETVENEGIDRLSIGLPGVQEELAVAVARANPRTVMVLVNGGPLAVNQAAREVAAILESWYSGEEGGTAIAEALFGRINPAGRLPVTFPVSEKDLPPMDDYDVRRGRTYMYADRDPLFAFGYGLSYTSFAYENIGVSPAVVKAGGKVRVVVGVRNTGELAGDEVVQLYLSYPPGLPGLPRRRLAGFRRITLGPGEGRKVEFIVGPGEMTVTGEDLKPAIPGGSYAVTAGGSLKGKVSGGFRVVPR